MANTNIIYRTNYFRVTDEEAYKKIYNNINAEDIEDFSEEKDGILYHGFGGFGSISYCDCEKEIKELFKKRENKIFDQNNIPISLEDAISKEELFDENGICIFAKYDADDNFYGMIAAIQAILPEDECFIYNEINYEKLRFVNGYNIVATHTDKKEMSSGTFIETAIKELVGEDAGKNIRRPYY